MKLPPQVFLEITRACDQACPFCSCPWFAEGAPSGGPELTAEEWRSVISEFVANGVRFLALTGGEPTLKSGWQELLRHGKAELMKHHPEHHELALFTNGKHFRPGWAEILRECRTQLYLSLPGLNSFPEQTGRAAGDFRDIVRLMHALRDIPVTVGVTVTKTVLPELYETLSYAVLSGAEGVVVNLFKPSGRGAAHPELLLSEAEILMAAQTAEDVAEQCGGTVAFGGEFPPCVRPENFPRLTVENRCLAARGTFTVAPDGSLHACEYDPEALCFWKEWRTLSAHPRWRRFSNCMRPVCPLA